MNYFERIGTVKWPETGAHVVDFTCDQMYREGSNENEFNGAATEYVESTWDYYAIHNVSEPEVVLDASHYFCS